MSDSFLTSKKFWIATAERAIKTGFQAVILFWGVGDGMLSLWSVNPKDSAGFFLGGVLLSVVTSLGSGALSVGPNNSPSVTDSR